MDKLFFKITLCAAVAVSLVSCNDFLDKEVKGYATDKSFYDTQYKMQSALDAAYDVLQSDAYNDQEWRFGEGMSDNVFDRDEGTSTQMGQLVNFIFNTSNTWILQRWNVNYKGIHSANQVIYNIDRVKISTDSYSQYQDIRNIYGQAKFLRAFYYFNLVKSFGGVPIRPEQESADSLVMPRSSKEACYAYIENDLREAAVMLPSSYFGTSNLGKATRGVAVALLMKVLMYEATNGVKSDKWQQVVELGKYMVDGDPITYREMLRWNGNDEEWETLRERLWFKPRNLITTATEYESPDDELSNISKNYSLGYLDYYGNVLHGGDKWAYCFQFYSDGEFCKSSVFEVVFKESADGSSGDNNEGFGLEFFDVGQLKMYTMDELLSNIFVTGDARRDFVIHHQTTTFDGQNWQGGEGMVVSLKWYTPLKDKPKFAGDNGKNRRVMRYPEVVLTYAEALNECGESQEALEKLNMCKAQVNSINNSTVLYQPGGYGFMRDQIWRERRAEMAFEWDRYFDLVRTGQAASVMHAFGNRRTNRRGAYFRERVHELLPIPQTEVDVSNGVVVQNPGY
ncbi:RagB/SusD family nutrient uptake outer membrane protein [Segatella buccae]